MADMEQKTNPVLEETVQRCEEAARRNDAAVWARVADELRGPTRQMREVDLSTIERNADDGDTVVVPGVVTGDGRLTSNVTVAAFKFTGSSMEDVNGAGEAMYIDALVDERPGGDGVVLLG
ncbi:MAG: 50S ribosomal protein L18e [Candidatus Nanohaloarchaea archaeon]|nr:50S ribosomal protein L18e [Candidatus Nanohaloarchaea archaeon]